MPELVDYILGIWKRQEERGEEAVVALSALVGLGAAVGGDKAERYGGALTVRGVAWLTSERSDDN